MSYSVASDAHKQAHGDIYNNSVTGITDSMIDSAFNMVNARLDAKGIAHPASSTILSVAEEFYIQAKLLMKGRFMGDLPVGGQGNISAYDNVNKGFLLLITLGNEQVDNYIASVTSGSSTGSSDGVQPSDTDGVPRLDAVGKNFKLHQRLIGTFTEV